MSRSHWVFLYSSLWGLSRIQPHSRSLPFDWQARRVGRYA